MTESIIKNSPPPKLELMIEKAD
jgi:WD40 repeat protein